MPDKIIPVIVDKSPETFSLITYVWIICWSALGGVVAFMRKVRSGHARAWNFAEFVGEITTSAFAGILTFYLCQAAGMSSLITAALVGIAGHAGSRAIFLFENYLSSRFPSTPPSTTERKGDHDEFL